MTIKIELTGKKSSTEIVQIEKIFKTNAEGNDFHSTSEPEQLKKFLLDFMKEGFYVYEACITPMDKYVSEDLIQSLQTKLSDIMGLQKNNIKTLPMYAKSQANNESKNLPSSKIDYLDDEDTEKLLRKNSKGKLKI